MIRVKEMNEEEVRVICDNGKEYTLNRNTFAALSNNLRDPLSLVSLSNSSFSIDMWKGCKYDCAYCHVQGCYNNLIDGSMNYIPVRKTSFSEEDVVNKLIKYKHFHANESLISIATSSTEPFANKDVTDSTIELMEQFINLGYFNPFWIVTKGGVILHNQMMRIKRLIDKGAIIIVSICWTNNDSRIEPIFLDRFSFAKELDSIGVHLNWYMRPLVREWNASPSNLEFIMKHVAENDYPIKSIIAGGLRWTSGIEFGIEGLHNYKLPKLIIDDNKKTLDDDIIQNIISLHKKYLPTIPLFFKSSCCISYALKIPNINHVELFEDNYCKLSYCPFEQSSICFANHLDEATIDDLNKILKDSGYIFEKFGEEINLIELYEHSYKQNILLKRFLQKYIQKSLCGGDK